MVKIVKRIAGIAAFIVGTVLFAGLALAALLAYGNSPPPIAGDALTGDGLLPVTETGDPSAVTVRFEVRKGESGQSVGQRLADAGVIRSRSFWNLLCRYNREYVKSGSYLLELPASQIAIHTILVSGKQMMVRVTVPEGLTLKKTAALFDEAGICSADEFLAAAADSAIIGRYRIPGGTMEGYLCPDTYLFPPEYPAVKVIETMADTFFKRIGDIDEKTLSMPPEQLNDLVILASIVEREYRLDEEAPVMAGVFLNRLDIGMGLQSCATVEYIITEIEGRPHPEVLTSRDIEIRNSYNTYVRPGLPPGPISSPGAVALRSVLFPSKSDYLYFRLVDPDSGKHYFSGTLDDHIRAGKLYVKRQNG